MQTKINKLEILNQIIYENLSRILKKLNKRIHNKLYALVYDKNQTHVETIRVKRTVAKGEKSTSISQNTLQTMANIYTELRVDPANTGNTYDSIKKYVNEIWYKEQHYKVIGNNGISDSEVENDEGNINDTRILYVNEIPYKEGESTYSVVYIVEIRNVENETRQLFYTKPEISFFRMLLDYFFNDFFAHTNNAVEVNNDDSITRKYNEDGIQFNRRLTRLFFGKLQHYIQKNIEFDKFGIAFENELSNVYYVNSLLEKIDDISSLTYENSSPFGSILFLNSDVIANRSIIRFTVKFTKEDRVRLEDAKRIRKLLELTNVERDLYLIGDEWEIYGLGEVNWNLQKGTLALRLDFTGLSKYNFVLVRTETEPVSEGNLFVEDEKKYYRSDLSLIETKLISISFKNPRLGEEGYSTEKFKKLLKNIFWENYIDYNQINHKMEKLDQIVRKAREQKHGTMVVITENTTAKEELSHLSKQSTLIEPGIINPEYIKFLTAIDGAIYFDSDGNCHAIGVILDGIAKEDIGDASRGARYNSAHRYLHKLKTDEQKKCVIVIISEDGMVDLIPELENEDMLLELAEDIIDIINIESFDADKLKEKEEILLKSKIVDCDWLFNIAEVYQDIGNKERAIDFFEYGIKQAEKSFILPKNYNLLGNCYFETKRFEEAIKMYELALECISIEQSRSVYLGNIGQGYFALALQRDKSIKEFNESINRFSQSIELAKTNSIKPLKRDYSYRARCYLELSDLEKNREKKKLLLKSAVEDYSQAIIIEPNDNILYWSRFCCYDRLGQVKDSCEDLIRAECIKHEDKYIDNLTQLFDSQSDLVPVSIELYGKLVGQNESSPQLEELLSKYAVKIDTSKLDEVAAAKDSNIDENKE
ncbi:diadenylate cyclase [Paenibacillus sp. MABNS29]|uniref:tetratricopeptide repeat protein n=1 Tax=Paenibacillus sp. MABNS29 TaxID=3142627 RepID=UPI003D27EBFD